MKQAGGWVDMSSTTCVLFTHILQITLGSVQGEGERKEEIYIDAGMGKGKNSEGT
jgi:hypothetical protein